MWCRTATSCTSVSTYDRYGQPVIYHVESRPVRFPPRLVRRALVFAMLVLRPVGSLRIGATPVPATAHRRQTVRFVGILVGARLGHCLFYEPGYFLAHPLEMILPMRQTANGWVFTGYAGLASHGGTIGLMLALWLYVRKTKLNIMRVLDNIAIATPASAMFIRLGNLMNSEIIGKPTDVPWAFVFERVDMLPRHPGQLYEAICYFVFLIAGYVLYHKYPQKVGTGFYFGFCLTTIFTARFFIEYTKEVQEAWEAAMPINMGQILSIPFILLGAYCMAGGKLCRKLGEPR